MKFIFILAYLDPELKAGKKAKIIFDAGSKLLHYQFMRKFKAPSYYLFYFETHTMHMCICLALFFSPKILI